MSFNDTLKGLLRPSYTGYRYGGIVWETYLENFKVWEASMPEKWEEAISSLEGDGEVVPREAVLKLAVITNQMRRDSYLMRKKIPDFYKKLKSAEVLCEKFKVKGLMRAADIHWGSDRPSSLEVAIDKAVEVGGMGEVHCRRCGRLLSNRLSVQRGIGPICLAHVRNILNKGEL